MKDEKLNVEQHAVPQLSFSVPQRISAKMINMRDRYSTSDVFTNSLGCVGGAKLKLQVIWEEGAHIEANCGKVLYRFQEGPRDSRKGVNSPSPSNGPL